MTAIKKTIFFDDDYYDEEVLFPSHDEVVDDGDSDDEVFNEYDRTTHVFVSRRRKRTEHEKENNENTQDTL